MKNQMLVVCCLAAALMLHMAGASVFAQQGDELIVAAQGRSHFQIVVAADAGKWEKQAADDLAKYIEMMTGAQLPVVNQDDPGKPAIVVGSMATKLQPSLTTKLQANAKKNPTLRADAAVVQRQGNRIYVAGNNDESHYFAASVLLHHWGCRWYIPGDIGEHVPAHDRLTLGDFSYAHGSPFEIRHFWNAWNGSQEGREIYQRRNFMSSTTGPGMGHALDHYTRDLAPEGKTHFNVPFGEIATAEHVVKQIGPKLEESKAKGISLAIADGSYDTDSPIDNELRAGLEDKYFLKPNLTDPMMRLYSNVGKLLEQQYPDSQTKFGALAYTNVTIPPQRQHDTPENLIIWLAPIDIDPVHGMDDVVSPPRREYKHMMYRWAEIMDGRVAIYDYDQGMLVWRDIPNPSHMAFVQDVKHYRDAGILGIGTESRNAISTIGINMYLRGALMWNPDADIEKLIDEYYVNFYGPAAEPMKRYWDAIFKAWDETIVTEHEYFVIPAIYTPELVEQLRKELVAAEQAVSQSISIEGIIGRRQLQIQQRMQFIRASFNVLSGYISMVDAAATKGDYVLAAKIGKQVMEDRLTLAKMNPTFTTRVVGPAAEPTEPKGSAAWLPGEVKQYMQLAEYVDDTKGTLIKQLPLRWAFRRDPHDTGLASGWAYRPADLTYWNNNKESYQTPGQRKDYPTTEWEMVDTDLYYQAQGVLHPDWQSFTGYAWYKTNIELAAGEVDGNVHIRFPGMFNEAWLYVNGWLVAHRELNELWWYNDYAFEWDVDLAGRLKPGENDITVRLHNPHHFGGMFRRPFLYEAR